MRRHYEYLKCHCFLTTALQQLHKALSIQAVLETFLEAISCTFVILILKSCLKMCCIVEVKILQALLLTWMQIPTIQC